MRSIVVGVDGSPPSEKAVAAAVEMALLFRAHLTVVAAYAPPLIDPSGTAAFATSSDASSSLRQRYDELVRRKVDGARAAGVDAEGLVREGSATDVLLAVVDEKKADLLVVGSRGLSRTHRLLLGSVSMAVASAAPCPVLLFRDTAPEGSRSASAATPT